MKKLVFLGLVGWLAVAPVQAADSVIERMKKDLAFLASADCEGRGVETEGIDKAASYIVASFKEFGLAPGGVDGSYFQPFTLTGRSRLGKDNALILEGPGERKLILAQGQDYQVSGLSASGEASGDLVFVGHGITTENGDYDDYAEIDVKDKVVVILRKTPRPDAEDNPFPRAQAYSPLLYKLSNAIKHGASGVIFVSDAATAQKNDPLMAFRYARGTSPSAFPVLHMKRSLLDQLFAITSGDSLEGVEAKINETLKPRSQALEGVRARLRASIERKNLSAKNVIGVLEGKGPQKDEIVIIGSHYDHLGRGEVGSLARGDDRRLIHYGADDNGSGTTGMLELARRFGSMPNRQGRTLVFMAFSAEERGLLGSRHYVENPLFPLDKTVTMINLDMVGRLNNNQLEIGGTGTAAEFDQLVDTLNQEFNFTIKKSAGGLGPSDHASFYPKNIPVFFFFTGLHENYHRPTDTPDRINYEGMIRIIDMVEEIAQKVSSAPEAPEYRSVRGGLNPRRNRPRGPTLGFMPGNYDESQEKGLPVAGISKEGPAEKAGLKEGDIIVAINNKPVTNIGTYMTAMAGETPGKELEVTILRAGKKLKLKATPR